MVKVRQERISFRAEPWLVSVIHQIAQELDMTDSELIRAEVIAFHMGFLSGQFRKSYFQMSKRVLKMFGSPKMRAKYEKLYPAKKIKKLLPPNSLKSVRR